MDQSINRMWINFTRILCRLMFLMLLLALPAFAQNASVTVGKQAGRIPKACEAVVPASIEGTIDIPALVKEAYCKGAGDMIAEYSYVMNSGARRIRRVRPKKDLLPTKFSFRL